MKQVQKIKEVQTSKFVITLFELENGRYEVQTDTYKGVKSTAPIRDYGTAAYVFDLFVRDLQGN